ncbi:MAG: DegT/DnrJ/EryC1/StrS family aminotransferase [Treponema sp.]|jgi:dTDP-4-amino-4,6-dideoxygalactose transaminase|nr:DegT/DnrJ/EryC1/StrS family aminotransferase [Treponema sp.]
MPSRSEPIPFSRPFTGKEEEDAVIRVLRSGWLTTGKETLAFESEFGAFVKTPCLAVNSATSGLHLALEACGTGPGDLVLVPSYTFTSTAEVVRYLGAETVFVDVAPGTFHIDPLKLETTLEQLPPGKARAVIPVHYGGLPCDMEAVLSIAEKYRLKVIEDAAHSFPSPLPPSSRVPAGSFAGAAGDAGVFSFYATKTITTGEGGMIASKNPGMIKRMSVMRSHGIDRSVWNRYTDTKASWYYEVIAPGFKYNIPDLLSAIGRVQLSRAMLFLAMRQDIAAAYDRAFAGDERFTLPPSGPGDARHLYPLRLNPERLSITRDEFIEKLQEQGVGVSVHFIPLHTMPYYKKRYKLKDDDFPESLSSFRRVISLPIWPGMTGAQVERVITVVKELGFAYTIA